jgi:hypothetical protein
LVQLASKNSKLLRSVDPDFYAIAVGPDDGDRDPVTDLNRLAALSAEYQHEISSLKRGFERRAVAPYPVVGLVAWS